MPNRTLTGLYASKVTDRYAGLPPEPPSALAAVVLHAVVLGTTEVTYKHLEGMETAQARRERTWLRDELLTRTGLTTAERAALLDAQASDALLDGTANLDQLDASSAALIALVPHEPSAHTTRAAVLALMGRQERRAPFSRANAPRVPGTCAAVDLRP